MSRFNLIPDECGSVDVSISTKPIKMSPNTTAHEPFSNVIHPNPKITRSFDTIDNGHNLKIDSVALIKNVENNHHPARLDSGSIHHIEHSTRSEYNKEFKRLQTFNRWSKPYIAADKLARCGFYYYNGVDTVKCNFCKVEIGQFDIGDDPLREHKRWAPNCPLITKQPTDNVPLDEDKFNAYIREGEDVCGYSDQSTEINHPDFAIKQARLDSFKDWPKFAKQRPEELADAGLFYLNIGDQVKCYACAGGLKDWEETDVPWEEHALWYGDTCMFVKLVKGLDYIKEVKDKYNAKQNQSTDIIESEIVKETSVDIVKKNFVHDDDDNDELEDSRQLCKICYANELDTIIMPCMHVVTCGRCALTIRDCPVCRKTIVGRSRIYFS